MDILNVLTTIDIKTLKNPKMSGFPKKGQMFSTPKKYSFGTHQGILPKESSTR